MISKRKYYLFFIVFVIFATSCSDVPSPPETSPPGGLRFSSERALEMVTEFLSQFPNRDSGPEVIIAAGKSMVVEPARDA